MTFRFNMDNFLAIGDFTVILASAFWKTCNMIEVVDLDSLSGSSKHPTTVQ